MKKLILFLLLPLWAMAQTSTGQEQEFDYGIKNNSTQTITTPPYLTTTGMDGTQGKIPSALIEKTDNKQNSLTVDGTGTKYPTVDAVNTGLALKALDSNVVHKSGTETITGEKTIKNKLNFTSPTDVVTMSIPQLSTAYSAENTVLGVDAAPSIAPIQFTSPTYGLITGGTANTVFGKYAGYSLNAGNENTLIGHKAGYNLLLPIGNDPNFYSSLNTFIGSNAGYNTTTGYANIFIGQKAGQNVTTARHNVIIGKSAGGDGTLGTILDGNVIIGSGAAKESVYSRYNTFVGADAGHFSDGVYNVFLGTGAGDGTNVSHHFIAGSDIGYINDVYFGKGYKSASPTSYTIHGTGGVGSEITGGNLVLAGGTGTGNANGGDVVIQTSDIVTAGTQAHYLTDAVTIKSISQNVGIGTGSPSEKLEVNGNIKAASFIKAGGTSSEFLKADGSVTTLTNPVTGTGTTNYIPKWTSSSTQGSSIISDNGTDINVNGNIRTTKSLFTKSESSGVYGYNSAGITEIGYLLFNQYTGVTLSSSTANPFKINNNGSETARFINGKLLIGTTTDTGGKLQVNGTITASPATLSNQVVVKSQLDLKADLASPTFTGTVTAPTFIGNLSGNATSANTVTWSGITSKPTTLSGYGITDNFLHTTGDETKDGSLFITKLDPDFNELTAIKGITTGNGYGVKGESPEGVGVSGYSNNGVGVYGGSNTAQGVFGNSNIGVGVYGGSDTGQGVYGSSDTGQGVYGYSNSGVGALINVGSSSIQPIAKFQKADVDKVVIQNDGTIVASNYNGGAALTGTPTAPTAAPGTTGNQIATLDYVLANTTARPYKVYTALLSQSGTNAPTATVLENTLGGSITWSRNSVGLYLGTLENGFNSTLSKVRIFISGGEPSLNPTGFYNALPNNIDSVQVNTRNTSGSLADSLMSTGATIEIRVYN